MDSFIVKDSSIWLDPVHTQRNSSEWGIKLGTVMQAIQDSDGDIRYMVKIFEKNNTTVMYCQPLQSLGGVFNFEETVLQMYESTNTIKDAISMKAEAGDMVAVA